MDKLWRECMACAGLSWVWRRRILSAEQCPLDCQVRDSTLPFSFFLGTNERGLSPGTASLCLVASPVAAAACSMATRLGTARGVPTCCSLRCVMRLRLQLCVHALHHCPCSCACQLTVENCVWQNNTSTIGGMPASSRTPAMCRLVQLQRFRRPRRHFP